MEVWRWKGLLGWKRWEGVLKLKTRKIEDCSGNVTKQNRKFKCMASKVVISEEWRCGMEKDCWDERRPWSYIPWTNSKEGSDKAMYQVRPASFKCSTTRWNCNGIAGVGVKRMDVKFPTVEGTCGARPRPFRKGWAGTSVVLESRGVAWDFFSEWKQWKKVLK